MKMNKTYRALPATSQSLAELCEGATTVALAMPAMYNDQYSITRTPSSQGYYSKSCLGVCRYMLQVNMAGGLVNTGVDKTSSRFTRNSFCIWMSAVSATSSIQLQRSGMFLRLSPCN